MIYRNRLFVTEMIEFSPIFIAGDRVGNRDGLLGNEGRLRVPGAAIKVTDTVWAYAKSGFVPPVTNKNYHA